MYQSGEELWPLVGQLHTIDVDIVMASFKAGERWSFFGTSPPSYLSGPVLLINHACHRHSNVIIKRIERHPRWMHSPTHEVPQNWVMAIAETRICAGDRVYATYDLDSAELKRIRGIECMICAKG